MISYWSAKGWSQMNVTVSGHGILYPKSKLFRPLCISAAAWHRHNTHPGAIKKGQQPQLVASFPSLFRFRCTALTPLILLHCPHPPPSALFCCCFTCGWALGGAQSRGFDWEATAASQPAKLQTQKRRRGGSMWWQRLLRHQARAPPKTCDSVTLGSWGLEAQVIRLGNGSARGSPSRLLFDNFVPEKKEPCSHCLCLGLAKRLPLSRKTKYIYI